MKAARRAGEAPLLGDGDEVFQVPQFHSQFTALMNAIITLG